MNSIIKATTSLVIGSLFAVTAFAAPDPIATEKQLDLREWTGISFLQTMIWSEEGVVDVMEADYRDSYEFPTWSEVAYAIDNFDDKNRNRVLRVVDYDMDLLRDFTEQLAADHGDFTPENIADKVWATMKDMDLSGNRWALGQFFAIAGGAGVLVHIDENNYYYNIGYYEGEVKSGRSYGATLTHNANDASHLMYLRELDHFLAHENDYEQFFRGIMDFLVDTDVSVFDDPSFNKYGEAVLTDFITVYTAELRRHLMKDLHPYRAAWGNDMAEATFLSLFNVKSGLMMLEGELVEDSIEEHWALSRTGSGRSGFGINRKDRRKLQLAITNYYRKHEDPAQRAIVERLDDMLNISARKDVYRGVMEFLNNKKNLEDHTIVEAVEGDIQEAFVEFLMAVYRDTDKIAASLR